MNQITNRVFNRASNQPLISVIVPVYNTVQYLGQCLDSILEQTLTDIEIIVVNDASPDQSSMLLKRYQQQYGNRIKVVTHATNRGLAAARNTGLDHAKGQFIGFVDSDDFIVADMYEQLLSASLQQGAELAVAGMTLQSTEHSQVLAFKSKVENTSACNKLFARQLIKRAQLRFAHGQLFEDEVFVLQAFMHAKRIAYVDHAGYIYRANEQGICRRKGQDQHRLHARMATITDLLATTKPQYLAVAHQQMLLLALCRHAMLQLQSSVDWYDLRNYWLFSRHLIERYQLNRQFDAMADDYFVRHFKSGSDQLGRLWLWFHSQQLRRWLQAAA
ncbi:hypothetical protein GCM10011369_27350 [Neiella marina]|uniref:Glycosyltransferase 2-like domain-containing protein n=1 Tax=Neiella marina TaxID=508461 RepID=A0A8J2U7J5_9GAMM|nr:glycosyltransferase [Neiella marina]GGA83863.1 hypothetical protein GCM10011369_27350 [Neiella marina]